MTLLPLELIERILYYSDGRTLKVAHLVDPAWGDIVNYLTEKTNIWKWCCHEDIPHNELVNYIDKYENYLEDSKWFNIYDNWYLWHNIKDNVRFETVLCPVNVPRITHVAVSGTWVVVTYKSNIYLLFTHSPDDTEFTSVEPAEFKKNISESTFIAVGSEDGRVKIFEETWGLLHTARYQAVKITDITFMYDDESGPVEADRIFLLLAYKTGTLILTEFDGKLNELAIIQDVKLHSVYQKYLCYERRGGRITISKLCRESNGSRFFGEITFLRIYSPNEVSCLHMWSGVATFLINNEVKVLKFDQNIPPVSSVENKVHITFCNKNQSRLARSCHIYTNDIIICASTDDGLREQFLEVFILGKKNQYSKKLFNSWTALHANITCMFLYGSIFVVGVDIGNIYFYQVTSWKTFDIRDYQKKVIIGQHPIIGIDVKETKQERKFFVTSSFNIHQVVGFTVSST